MMGGKQLVFNCVCCCVLVYTRDSPEEIEGPEPSPRQDFFFAGSVFDLTGSYNIAFGTLFALVALSSIVVLTLPETKKIDFLQKKRS